MTNSMWQGPGSGIESWADPMGFFPPLEQRNKQTLVENTCKQVCVGDALWWSCARSGEQGEMANANAVVKLSVYVTFMKDVSGVHVL